MSWTQVDKVLFAIDNFTSYWNRNRGFEVSKMSDETSTANILYNGNNVGWVRFESEYSDRVYIVLTLNAKFLPTRACRNFSSAANRSGIAVLFVPSVDIGFGVANITYTEQELYRKILPNVAKHSTDDVKTAAMVGTNVNARIHIGYVTYNQRLGEEIKFVHAEKILSDYLEAEESTADYDLWHSLLEPCEHCLKLILAKNARWIHYLVLHKDKWNTPSYFQLVNDLHNHTIKTNEGRPIFYTSSITALKGGMK